MKGGVRVYVDDLVQKYDLPIEILLGCFMAIIIVFLDKVPLAIRQQADTFMGRALLLVFTALVVASFGWPLGFLAAILSALLIGSGGLQQRKVITEGFSPDMNVRIVPTRHKWYVERVLGENPLLIEDQTVDTSAVQDLSEKYGGSVQSNTVTR
jgi:hypothetical protein